MPSAFETWPTATIFVRGVEQLLELVEDQLAARRSIGDDAQRRALLLAEHLPGDDVRVVLDAR